MQRPRIAHLGLVLLFLAAGCMDRDHPTAPAHPGDALHAISDGAHNGTEGFYFLPPMVKNPAYSGTFDASLSPVVEVCATPACAALHASYSMTQGVGSEVVRISGEHYMVNWHTNQTEAAAGETYRVRVLVNSVVLGHADVAVVSTGREAIEVRSDGSIALVANQTLPVQFRIETGIVGAVLVTPEAATIEVGATQQFTATLRDLHGEPLVGPAVTWSSDDAGVATVDTDGLATGVGNGEATITASAGPVIGEGSLEVVALEAEWVMECPFAGSGGDNISRGFYVAEFPGAELRGIEMSMHSTEAGEFGMEITARSGTYDGSILGVGTAAAALTTSADGNVSVTFDFGAVVTVVPGSIVTFLIRKVSGPTGTLRYDIGACAGECPPTCPVIQTNGSTPPLDTFRRNRVGVRMY